MGKLPTPLKQPSKNDLIAFITTKKRISVSEIQRKFQIGINSASYLWDQLVICKIIKTENNYRKGIVIVKDINKAINALKNVEFDF